MAVTQTTQNPPFAQPDTGKSSYAWNFTFLNENVKFKINLYKTHAPAQFPEMTIQRKLRQKPDMELDESEKKHYFVYKADEEKEGAEEISPDNAIKTLRYGKNVIKPISRIDEGDYSKTDGVATVLGSENVMIKSDRMFKLFTFVKKEEIPSIYYTGNEWKITTSDIQNNHFLKVLCTEMIKKGVYGLAKLVITKGYVMRLIAIVPVIKSQGDSEEKYLLAKEIPWGSLFIADGLDAKAKANDNDQYELMKKIVDNIDYDEELHILNPVLQRVWFNIKGRTESSTEIDKTMPLKQVADIPDELKEESQTSYNWRMSFD